MKTLSIALNRIFKRPDYLVQIVLGRPAGQVHITLNGYAEESLVEIMSRVEMIEQGLTYRDLTPKPVQTGDGSKPNLRRV